MKKSNEIILDTSDEAAQLKTITGWVSKDGRFYGSDESIARFAGCTHKTCECGKLMEKHWLRCEQCRNKSAFERYMKLPFREYAGEPVCLWDDSTYFFSEDDLICYCEDNDIGELNLLFCKPNDWREVDADYWSHNQPDEDDSELPKELKTALDYLNTVLRTLPPQSYSPGEIRTTYKLENY